MKTDTAPKPPSPPAMEVEHYFMFQMRWSSGPQAAKWGAYLVALAAIAKYVAKVVNTLG